MTYWPVRYYLHHQDPGQDQGAEGAPGPGAGLRRDPGHKPLAGEGLGGGAHLLRPQPAEQLCGQRAQPAAQPPRRLPPPPSPAPALRLPLHASQQRPQRPAPVCRQVGSQLSVRGQRGQRITAPPLLYLFLFFTPENDVYFLPTVGGTRCHFRPGRTVAHSPTTFLAGIETPDPADGVSV